MTSRLWQYISCPWDTCPNHSGVRDWVQRVCNTDECLIHRVLKQKNTFYFTKNIYYMRINIDAMVILMSHTFVQLNTLPFFTSDQSRVFSLVQLHKRTSRYSTPRSLMARGSNQVWCFYKIMEMLDLRTSHSSHSVEIRNRNRDAKIPCFGMYIV